MEIKESGEMYLETILLLNKRKPAVKSVDIVEELNYSKSSVSRGVNILKKKGYITIDQEGFLHFTTEGLNRAETVLERHKVLTDHLVKLGVDKTVAELDACRIEHVISDASFEAIKNNQTNAKLNT